MRTTAVVVTLLFVLALSAREMLWRLDHPLIQEAVPSPSGSQVAEVRSLPEGSLVPYGTGVFLRPNWAVVQSFHAELAFAGYCGTIAARWPSDQRLSIQCELLEEEPRVPSPIVNGTSVEVTVQRKQAANPSIHTDSAR